MMHLCFIRDQRMQEFDLAAPETEVFTLLSQWEPLHLKEDTLFLPQGWTVCRPDEAPTDRIPLLREGNYPLKAGEESALLMIRLGGPQAVQAVELLVSERFSVGRSRRNELCCRDGYLSSFHGVFSFDRDGAMWYEDESTNGTLINGEMVRGERRRLHTGDQLDFPPQMRVTVKGCVLHVRCPKEHTALTLPALPSGCEALHAALYLQPAGRLYHLQLAQTTSTLAAFLESAAAQIGGKDAGYLDQTIVLRDAETQTIIADDAALVETLRKGAPVLLAT